MRGDDSGVVLGLHRTRLSRALLEAARESGITRLDTAVNYAGFTAHRGLAAAAGDLLDAFLVSTKVGFFPAPGGRACHSLDPARLREALTRGVDDLGAVPDVVFLHNPERSLTGRDPVSAGELLAAAAAALEEAVADGWCARWGISSWRPDQLWPAVTAAATGMPVPQVVMVRAGLLAAPAVLDAGAALGAHFRLPGVDRWGMSPFGGSIDQPVWAAVDPRLLLAPGQQASRWQAGYRLAFVLPAGLGRVAVGTSSPHHLQELIDATVLGVDPAQLARYRRLLAATAGS